MPDDSVPVVFEHVWMQGPRFTDGALPLSAVDELRRYERLLENLARTLFLIDHPDRQRVSDSALGVEEFELDITRLTKGSVGVDLALRPRSDSVLVDGVSYAERARVLIESAFSDLAEGRQLSDAFPLSVIPDLGKLGTGLQEGESLTWSRSRRQRKSSHAILLRETTSRLRENPVPSLAVLAASIDQEELLNVYVTGLRTSPQEFDYVMDGGDRTHKGRYLQASTFPSLRAVVGFQARTPLVALSAKVDERHRVVDVLNIEVLLPPEWSSRLDAFTELRQGWLDGRGSPVTAEAIQTAESFLFRLLDRGLSRPGMYPTEEGGIQFEWLDSPSLVEVVVTGSGSIIAYHDGEDDAGFLGPVASVAERVAKVLESDEIP